MSDCSSGGSDGSPGGAPSLGGGVPEPTAGSFGVSGTFSTGAAGAAGAGGTTMVPEPCGKDLTTCAGRDIYRCQGAGVSPTFESSCGSGEHCEPAYFRDSGCVPDACQAGQPICFGNTVKLCADDGTIPEAGTDCGEQACSDGSCQPKICEPGSLFCFGGDVHLCGGQGAQSQIMKSCFGGRGCRPVLTTVECVPLNCLPGAVACVGNQGGKCADSGDELSAVTADCAGQGEVCDRAGACSPSVVDTLGGSSQVVSSSHAFNVIAVHSSRRVAKVELNLHPQQDDVNLHWQIVRLPPHVQEEVVAEADSVAHPGDTTASTTALNYVLEAGQSYRIGAAGDSGEVDFQAPVSLSVVSFGMADEQSGFAMRITTELP